MSKHQLEPFVSPLSGLIDEVTAPIQGLAPLATFYRRYAAGDVLHVRPWVSLVP